MNKIFVYGTLRDVEDEANKAILFGYYMYDVGPFPYISENECDDGAGSVIGQILEVPDKDMPGMDHYEGISRGLYTRTKVDVMRLDGSQEMEKCWVYVAGPALLPKRISSGDWYNKE